MRIVKVVFVIILSSLTINGKSQVQDLNAMIQGLGDLRDDTVKVMTLLDICDSLYRTRPEETLEYGAAALELSTRLGYTKGVGYSHKYIGMGYFVQSLYVRAMDNFQRALEKFEETGDKKGVANMLNNIGIIYNNEGNDAKALELYLSSLRLSEELDDSVRVLTALINIGLIYSKSETTVDKAREYYERALEFSENLNYYDAIGTVTVNIGELLFAKGNYKEALSYFQRSLSAYARSNTGNIPYTLIYIGKAYLMMNDFVNALKYQEEAYSTAEKSNSRLEMGQALISMGNTYLQGGDNAQALALFRRAEAITLEVGALYERREVYEGLARTYAAMSDYASAYRFQMRESALKDTLSTEASRAQLNQLQVQYEIESMLKENEILKRDVKLRDATTRFQMQIILTLVVGFVLILVFLLMLIRSNNQKKKINAELREKNELISNQKQAITDSISYARWIQAAILPPDDLIKSVLPDSFIFFRPRDIVSGDFYWITKTPGKIVCTAADCTGHGVPGALMSMLGVAFLNEIIGRNPEKKASEILDEMREKVVKSLHQDDVNAQSRDGIDMALVILDDDMKHAEFAGATNSLLIVREGELIEYKADLMPIGIGFGNNKPFTDHSISLKDGDMLYIFSDGYVDQFGGASGKKFRSKNLKELFVDIHSEKLEVQKEILVTRFEEWKGKMDQVDDILVMGIRISHG